MGYEVPCVILASCALLYAANTVQFRSNWTVDPSTGKYYTAILSPTNVRCVARMDGRYWSSFLRRRPTSRGSCLGERTDLEVPTQIPSDPPLAAYGVHQAEQLANALSAVTDPPITRVYSSPFFRCLQTLQPFIEKTGLEVRGDNGIGFDP